MYRKTIFPFMWKKMSWIVLIGASIITSMFTSCSSAPSIIDDLQNRINFILFSLFIDLKNNYIQLYLWQDFRCKAMQEILLSSSKYLILLQNMSNILKRYVVQFNSTNPKHHQTRLLMVCMFQRFLLVRVLFSTIDKINMFLCFL